MKRETSRREFGRNVKNLVLLLGGAGVGVGCPMDDPYYIFGQGRGYRGKDGIHACLQDGMTYAAWLGTLLISGAEDIAGLFQKHVDTYEQAFGLVRKSKSLQLEQEEMAKTIVGMFTYGKKTERALRRYPHQHMKLLGVTDAALGPMFRDMVFSLNAVADRSSIVPLISGNDLGIKYSPPFTPCSALALKSEITEEGEPYMIGTLDFSSWIAPVLFFDKNGLGAYQSIEQGISLLPGANMMMTEAGVCSKLNMSFGIEDNNQHLPFGASMQEAVKHSASTQEVVEKLNNIEYLNAGYALGLVLDGNNNISFVEQTPFQKYMNVVGAHYFAMTNHFQSHDPYGAIPFSQLSSDFQESTQGRLDFINEKMEATRRNNASGKIKLSDVVETFSSYPVFVKEPPLKETVCTSICLPRSGVMHYAVGKPMNEGGWVTKTFV